MTPPSQRPPLLREAHVHLAPLGESLLLPSLATCTSLLECLTRIRSAATGASGQWLRLTSARPAAWTEARWPTLKELDAATGHTPTVIFSFDHHQALANSPALTAAHLSLNQLVPPNGRVDPDGLLHEQAAYAAWNAAPEPTFADHVSHVAAALNHLSSLGFTEAHDLHSQSWLTDALLALAETKRLDTKVHLYPPVSRLREEVARFVSFPSSLTSHVSLAGGKLFADGTINARTALMLDPYVDGDPQAPRGRAMHTPKEIDDALLLCRSLGLHLATHAIGDAAVRMVLDAVQRVFPGAGASRSQPSSLSPRIEHAELIHPADIPRFAALGVTASLQPCHLLTDIEALHRHLPHALHKVLPIRSLIKSGLTPGSLTRGVIFGSDAPIVPADPQDSIQAAVFRNRGPTGREGSGPVINPSEAIDEATAWQCFASSDKR